MSILCPNSIFNDKDDILTTEYFTTEELNVEFQKSPDDIRLIHINAVSLCKNVDRITAMIAKLVSYRQSFSLVKPRLMMKMWTSKNLKLKSPRLQVCA